MNLNTMTHPELVAWIIENTDPDNVETWAARWLQRHFDSDELRDMVREVHEVGYITERDDD